MTTDPDNPFLGKTHFWIRPSTRVRQYRFFEVEALHEVQAQWDYADAIRRATDLTNRHIPVERDDTSEEPISKAVENRARTKFLSTKGATMREWLEQRDTILSN